MASPRKTPPAKNASPAKLGVSWIFTAIVLVLVAGGFFWAWRQRQPADANPVEDPKQAAVANALQATLRQAFSSPSDLSTVSVAGLIARMQNESLDLNTRREAAQALARLDDPQALAAIKALLSTGPESLKIGIAEGLGGNHAPEALQILLALLNNSDEAVSSAAIRGLALLNPEGAVDLFSNILLEAKMSEANRAEAAQALGESNRPGAYAALTNAITTLKDDAVVKQALAGLGRRPLAETNEFLTAYLADAATSSADRVAALEGLANSPNQAGGFLLKYSQDNDPAVREAAVWAIAAEGDPGNVVEPLTALVKNETSPEVRASLYQAISQQPGFDAGPLQATIMQETDPATRLAGLGLLAAASRTAPASNVATYFDQNAVPELLNQAIRSTDSSQRLLAVIDLRRARTDASNKALQEIADQSTDRKVVEAAQAALRTAHPRSPAATSGN